MAEWLHVKIDGIAVKGRLSEAKVEEFVARLQGWGWSCGASAAPAPEAAPEAEEAEPPVYDDTDVLSPGDPTDN